MMFTGQAREAIDKAIEDGDQELLTEMRRRAAIFVAEAVVARNLNDALAWAATYSILGDAVVLPFMFEGDQS